MAPGAADGRVDSLLLCAREEGMFTPPPHSRRAPSPHPPPAPRPPPTALGPHPYALCSPFQPSTLPRALFAGEWGARGGRFEEGTCTEKRSARGRGSIPGMGLRPRTRSPVVGARLRRAPASASSLSKKFAFGGRLGAEIPHSCASFDRIRSGRDASSPDRSAHSTAFLRLARPPSEARLFSVNLAAAVEVSFGEIRDRSLVCFAFFHYSGYGRSLLILAMRSELPLGGEVALRRRHFAGDRRSPLESVPRRCDRRVSFGSTSPVRRARSGVEWGSASPAPCPWTLPLPEDRGIPWPSRMDPTFDPSTPRDQRFAPDQLPRPFPVDRSEPHALFALLERGGEKGPMGRAATASPRGAEGKRPSRTSPSRGRRLRHSTLRFSPRVDGGCSKPALWLALWLAAVSWVAAGSPCLKWEHACRNGRCVPGTKYCDSIDNCGDLSDEPRHCSPCNRTYYGAVGVTLDLEIHRPREDGLPFLCPLTIAAAGGELGDIVQVSFDSFTVGRFAGSGPEGGCPEGGLQIREKGRPRIGGWFCGTAWGLGGGGGVGGGGAGGGSGGGVVAVLGDRTGGGIDGGGLSAVGGGGGAGTGPGRPPVFFSESDAVTLVLSLLPASQQHQAHPPAPAAPPRTPPAPPAMSRRSSGRLHTSYDFDFRISFKMLSKEAAVVRYGGAVPSFSGGYGNYHTIQTVNGGRGESSVEGGIVGADDDLYFPQIIHKNANKWRTKSSGLPVLLPPLLYPLPPPSLPSAPATPTPPPTLHLGDLIPGTFCSRLFGGCDRRTCALQSPNYPGLYPRNLTCYFAVRQHRAPKGQVALIAVAQRRGHLTPIPTAVSAQSSSYPARGVTNSLEQQGHAQTWPECDDLHDYVTVYDGYTTRDPVLLRFCGGLALPPPPPSSPSSFGPFAPTAISSGPELLVEFTSAPFGTLQPHFSSMASAASAGGAAGGSMISGFPPTASNSAQGPNAPPLGPASAIRGFQLQVKVRFVNQDSYLYARNKRCEFWIRPPRRWSAASGPPPAPGEYPTQPPASESWSRRESKAFSFSELRGTLRNPVHSLAANSTCVYHLIGEEEEEEVGGRGVGEGEDGVGAGWGGGWSGGRRTKPEYRVWLSVLKFHVAADPTPAAAGDLDECSSSLLVWDGVLGAAASGGDGGAGEGSAKGGGRWRGAGGAERQWDTACPHGFCGHRSPSSSGAPPLHHGSNSTTPLLARYCPVSATSSPPPPSSSSSSSTPTRPPSCEHALLANQTREVRPCSTRAQLGPFQRKHEGWRPNQQPQRTTQNTPVLGTVGDPPGTTPKEGFLSSGRSMDIQMIAAESTALRPVSFAAAYEFVDLSQDGEAFGEGPCSRRFSSRPPATLATVPSSPQRFTAPRNVFLYGRGGSANLSCTYRFEVQEGERVRITVLRLLTGSTALAGASPSCRTTVEPIGPHHRCITPRLSSRPPNVRLQLSDLPWSDLPVTRHCLCSPIPPSPSSTPTPSTEPPPPTTSPTSASTDATNATDSTTAPPPPSPTPPSHAAPFSYTSAPSRAVEVRFSAMGMGASHDPDSVFFEADVEFMRVEEVGFFPTRQESGKGKVAPMGKTRQKKCEAMSRRRFSGPSGELKIRIPKPLKGEELENTLHCASQPYLIVPSPGRFLYVRTRGFHMMPPEGIVSLPGRANSSSASSVPPCPTRNRLFVYSGDGGGAKLKAVICPLPPTSASVDPRQRVELFSEGWEESSRGPPPQPSSFLPLPLPPSVEGLFGDHENAAIKMAGVIVVEPMAAEDATYSLTWLEVVPRRSHRPLVPPPGFPIPFLQETLDASFLPSGECIHRCPELGACINASLWCDGRPHCPSAFDESLCEHSAPPSHHPLLRPPLLYASLALLLLLLLLLLALVLHLRARPPAAASRHAPCPSCLPNGTAAKSPHCAAQDAKGGGS